ncbi:MAG: oxygenase MpaB family protein [Gaiellaceae bacterium]
MRGAEGPLNSRHLDEILRLDPVRDHQRIVHLDVCYEFPWDTTRSLELALFRTFAVPSIARLLDSTGEFARAAQKRYDDTDLIISTILEDGYDSETGRRALRRMNQIHARFEIANEDFLYVLSTFVFEPIRWNKRFGWRLMVEAERLATFHCWREIARRMNIRDLPETYEALERFNIEYEGRHFARSEQTRRVGSDGRELFAAWFPRPLRPAVRRGIYALLDERLREAFGFPPPPSVLRKTVAAGLQARAKALRVFPPRRRPRLRTRLRRRAYPGGWSIETLGPPPASSSSRAA